MSRKRSDQQSKLSSSENVEILMLALVHCNMNMKKSTIYYDAKIRLSMSTRIHISMMYVRIEFSLFYIRRYICCTDEATERTTHPVTEEKHSSELF